MSLVNLKQEADLQEEIDRKSLQYTRLREERVAKLNRAVLDEFNEKLSLAGFTVKNNGARSIATYKSALVSLECVSVGDTRVECLAAFKACATNRHDKLICAFERKQESNMDFSISALLLEKPGADPESKLKLILNRIEETIDIFDKHGLEYSIFDPNDRCVSPGSKVYSSFAETLGFFLE